MCPAVHQLAGLWHAKLDLVSGFFDTYCTCDNIFIITNINSSCKNEHKVWFKFVMLVNSFEKIGSVSHCKHCVWFKPTNLKTKPGMLSLRTEGSLVCCYLDWLFHFMSLVFQKFKWVQITNNSLKHPIMCLSFIACTMKWVCLTNHDFFASVSIQYLYIKIINEFLFTL